MATERELLKVAEAELEALERQLDDKRAIVEWLRAKSTAASHNGATSRTSRIGPKPPKEARPDTWHARIDRVLATGREMTVAEITGELEAVGCFDGISMKPKNLIRATLGRCKERMGWTVRTKDGRGLWRKGGSP